jgi:hypothetical protein
MSRHGKIARLPLTLREELNQRLQNGEPGDRLLAWLNPRPEVQTILKEQFAGVPISKQNLHEWRAGGFAEWEFKRDLKYDAAETKADGAELDAVTDGSLADHLSTVLTARYASLIRSWRGETTDEFRAQLTVLRALIQDVSLLRRWDHSAVKISLATARLEDQREKAHQAELAELAQKVQRQQDFIQILESMVSDPPAAPPKPPEPQPAKIPVAASRESAVDLPQSNPVKVSQSTFTSPPSDGTAAKTSTPAQVSPNPAALPAPAESDPVKAGQTFVAIPLKAAVPAQFKMKNAA